MRRHASPILSTNQITCCLTKQTKRRTRWLPTTTWLAASWATDTRRSIFKLIHVSCHRVGMMFPIIRHTKRAACKLVWIIAIVYLRTLYRRVTNWTWLRRWSMCITDPMQTPRCSLKRSQPSNALTVSKLTLRSASASDLKSTCEVHPRGLANWAFMTHASTQSSFQI